MKKLIVFLLSILLLTSCGTETPDEETSMRYIKEPFSETEEKHESSTEKRQESEDEKDLGVWITYWDLDTAYEELDMCREDLDTLCLFAAYFDKDNRPFIPEGTLGTVEKLKQEGRFNDTENYLTFVNDKLLPQGSSLKDTDLLYDLLEGEKKARSHAKTIVDMTVSAGFDGIEIDYEAIKKDYELWEHFNGFIDILVPMATEKGLKVRVLFEPSSPFEQYEWPSDVEYVMMCYNLYGYGTGPGPKADRQFLNEMVDKMEKLPGKVNFALATGGFDFSSNGDIAQISTKEAKDILSTYEIEEKTDEGSLDHVFSYTDQEGIDHEVWYADRDTIEAWVKIIRERGHERFTIWRLGGNI